METLFKNSSAAEIMIVDDQVANLVLLTEILSSAGYRTRPATDSELVYHSVCLKHPDVILLDIKMPVLDGFEICRQLKDNAETKDIPVVFISALDSGEDLANAFSAGGADYISKPFRREEVLIRVKNQVDLALAHKQLKEQLIFQQNLLNTIPNPVYFKDPNGCYISCNKAFEKSFGLSSESIQGKTIMDLARKSNDLTAVNYCKVFHDKELELLNSDNNFVNLDAKYRFADGTIHDTITSKTVFLDKESNKIGTISVITDITELKQAEIKLQASLAEAERFREILDHVSSYIFMKDPQSHYVYANLQTLQLLNCTSEELTGSSDDRFFSPNTVKRLREIDLRVLAGEQTVEEVEDKERKRTYLEIKTPIYTKDADKKIWGLFGISSDISTHKKSQEQFKAIFESFPALIWMSGEDALCYYFNKTWLAFTGRSLEEEMGNGWAAGVHQDDFDRCLKIYLDSFAERKPFDMDYRLKHHSGEYRWISDHGQPFYNVDGKFIGYIGSCYDISETKNRELELLKLKAAIEQIGTTIVITDINGNIEYTNPYTAKLTGYTVEEAIGKNPRIFKSGKQDKAFYENLWQTISTGKVWKGRFTNKKKNGSFYEEDALIAPVKNSNGEIVNYIAIKQDVSEIVSLEDKLRRSQKMEAIGVLAAGIAHEINSPLQYLLDNTRFLEDNIKEFLKLVNYLKHHDFKCEPENCAKIKELVQAIDLDFINIEIPLAITENITGINKVRKIVSALKDFSFPRSFALTHTNINKALETILIITANSWKQHAKLEKNFTDDLPLIPCYADELNQVLINLIVNATDAIIEKKEKNGIIRISTKQAEEFIEISIADNGNGIPEEIKNRIFEPFFTTKEVGKGTGQGLAIVYDIIYNLHKGSIEVNSEVGKGTEFIIKLPLR